MPIPLVAPAIESLVSAIDLRAREIYADEGELAHNLADAKDLARALARMLSGQSLKAAFGSPGDWGYTTAIGKALADVYAAAAQAQRNPESDFFWLGALADPVEKAS